MGGDAAWGPENIIWAVEHGHQAAISIDNYCQGRPVTERPEYGMNLISTKMGIHEWSYANDYDPVHRTEMRYVDLAKRLSSIKVEAELGYDLKETAQEVGRCLNCDIQTDFTAKLCIECDACIDVCPVLCLTIAPDGEDAELRTRLTAPADNLTQPLFVSEALPQTKRVMVKDEDLCVHCGLCAERCPTAAWDMARFDLLTPYAGQEAWSSPTTAA
jgi:formate dehydrogenase beta subunit